MTIPKMLYFMWNQLQALFVSSNMGMVQNKNKNTKTITDSPAVPEAQFGV